MKKISAYFLAFSSTLLLILTIYLRQDIICKSLDLWVVDGDRYIELFQSFLDYGYWDSIANGTSIFYNISLYLIHFFTNNTRHSIFILNLFSLITSIGIVSLLAYKIINNKIYSYILTTLLIIYLINKRLPVLGNDDLFSGMLYTFIIYFLYKIDIAGKQHTDKRYLIGIGILLGLCFSIRELTILWLPIILGFCIYFSSSLKLFFRNITIIFTPMLFIILALHFPSIKEKGKLSFYDKNPTNKNLNWTQRNYIGLKKLEEGKIPKRPWAIWKGTSFDEVENYLIENGQDSLPRTLTQAFAKDPKLYLKITTYNIYLTLRHYFSVLGFILLLPLFAFFYRNGRNFVPYYLAFCLFALMICTVAYSLVEVRWFSGMEVFLFLSIIMATNNLYKMNRVKLLDIIYFVSLVIISLSVLKMI